MLILRLEICVIKYYNVINANNETNDTDML